MKARSPWFAIARTVAGDVVFMVAVVAVVSFASHRPVGVGVYGMLAVVAAIGRLLLSRFGLWSLRLPKVDA